MLSEGYNANYSFEYQDMLDRIISIYSKCKQRFIESEELLESMETFVAPLLEHRDALDHIVNAFKYLPHNELQAIDELKKAEEHEMRAFYDIADFVCIEIRREISNSLKRCSKRKIKKIWVDYTEKKEWLYKVSLEIANIRTKRTSSSQIEEYDALLNDMLGELRNFRLKIEPELHRT